MTDIKTVSVTKQVVEPKEADGTEWVDEYTIYAVREPDWNYYSRDAAGVTIPGGVDTARADATWKIDGTTLYVSSKQGALDYIELLQKIVAEYDNEEKGERLMGVKVTTTAYGDIEDTVRVYDNADQWRIDKGYLSVGAATKVVATYADGAWNVVELTKENA